MKFFIRLSILLLGLSLPFLSVAVESLDPGFGDNGQLTTEFSIYDDNGYAVAVQADGKIVVAGQSENGADTDIALARYNSDGSLDTDFNYTGQVTVAVGSGNDKGLALLIQEDGKILVAGTTDNGTDLDVAVIRLQSDGLPDMGFDHDGQVVISLPNSDDKAQSVLLQNDGKIILAGSSEEPDNSWLFLARLNSDGSLDTTFGSQGLAASPNDTDATAFSAALQNDDHIILAGFSIRDGVKRATLFSFLANGQADNAFGEQGIAYSGTEDEDSIFYDLATLEDGSILAAGASFGTSYRSVLLTGFTKDGTLYSGFNNQGMVQTDLGIDSVAYGLAIAPDNSIYLAGSGSRDNDTDFILLHYSGDGQIIQAIPGSTANGKEVKTETTPPPIDLPEESDVPDSIQDYTLTDFAEYDDVAHSLIIEANGTILLAGSAGNGKDSDFGLIRFSTAALAASRVENGVSTDEGYYIATTPPANVTRNSATSGGFLERFNRFLVVDARGVCYGISPAPGLKDFSDTDGGGDATQTTTTAEEEPDPEKLNPFKATTIREGCTSDGSGQGRFRSDILDITPDTTYYVRAYATLKSASEGTVTIYGNELQFTTKDACFIATAAYGGADKTQVRILRDFRDSFLKSSSLGRKLINGYYHLSPPLAEMISERPLLQQAVRIPLAPITAVSYFALHPLLALQAGVLFFICIALLQLAFGKRKTTNCTAHGAHGFTLIELLVVLVIIGILAGYVGPRIMGHPEDAKRTMAAAQMSAIETAIETYKLDNGMYPSTEQGLQALVEAPPSGKLASKWRKGGYMKKGKVPKDPWGNDYVYLSPGSHSDFDIISYGSDNESGGEDENADINNWEIE